MEHIWPAVGKGLIVLLILVIGYFWLCIVAGGVTAAIARAYFQEKANFELAKQGLFHIIEEVKKKNLIKKDGKEG